MNRAGTLKTSFGRDSDTDACRKAIGEAVSDGTYCLGLTGMCKDDSAILCTELAEWMKQEYEIGDVRTVSPPFDGTDTFGVQRNGGAMPLVIALDIDLMDSVSRDALFTLPGQGTFLLYAASVPYSFARTYELRPLDEEQALEGMSEFLKIRLDGTDVPPNGMPDTDYYISLMKKNMNSTHYLHAGDMLDRWEEIMYRNIPDERISAIEGYLNRFGIGGDIVLPLMSVMLYTDSIRDDLINRFIPVCTPSILPLINVGLIEHRNNSVRTNRTNRIIIRKYIRRLGCDTDRHLRGFIENVENVDLNDDLDARRCIIRSYRNLLMIGLSILNDEGTDDALRGLVDKMIMKLIGDNILICSYEDVDCIKSLLRYYIEREKAAEDGDMPYAGQLMSMLGILISLEGMSSEAKSCLFSIHEIFCGTAENGTDTCIDEGEEFPPRLLHRMCMDLYIPENDPEKNRDRPSNFINFLYLHRYEKDERGTAQVIRRVDGLNSNGKDVQRTDAGKPGDEKTANEAAADVPEDEQSGETTEVAAGKSEEKEDADKPEDKKADGDSDPYMMVQNINRFIRRIQISRIMHMSHIYSEYADAKCRNSEDKIKDGLRKYIYGGLSQYYDIRDSGLVTLPEDYETGILTEMAEDLIASNEYIDASNILDKLRKDYVRCRPVYRARIDQCRGTFCFRLRNYPEAMEAYESARDLYRDIGDTAELYLLDIKLLNVRISSEIYDNDDLTNEIDSLSEGFSRWFPDIRDEAEYLLEQIRR